MTTKTTTRAPKTPSENPATHFDVVIVGAGLSGIGAACYLQQHCPSKSFTLLEARENFGGTWDLFRYPGVRSDSDMQTLGFSFKPWTSDKSIADGADILEYIQETAAEFDVERRIKYHHKLVRAKWDSGEARWGLEIETKDGRTRYTCAFLYMCSGYYDYDEGYTPQWQNVEAFKGRVVHPQAWSEDISVRGQNVVVIGSGATAITLVPELAKEAAHVTMLQRSPTYIAAMPAEDAWAKRLHRTLPHTVAHQLTRWKNLLYSMYVFKMARWQPEMVKREMVKEVQKELGSDYDVETHFTPHYNPWDQQLCLAPDGDFFETIKSGQASVVTDEIDTFTETGLKLKSGEQLDADIIVTATGLKLKLVGGIKLFVDEAPIEMSERLAYKGAMYSGIPNFATAVGYTNASWTLKCELISGFVCRLLTYMDKHGYAVCTPQRPGASVQERPAIDLSSGYIRRSSHLLPRQGGAKPWVIHQNYFQDITAFRYSSLEDGALQFRRVTRDKAA